jgi:hypothetical protein
MEKARRPGTIVSRKELLSGLLSESVSLLIVFYSCLDPTIYKYALTYLVDSKELCISNDTFDIKFEIARKEPSLYFLY